MTKPLSIIAAVASNGAIGKDNDLLWHISEDLKYFKRITNGHTIIMGRKTFESFPRRPLPNRKHIILSKNFNADPYDNCYVVSDIEAAIKMCENNDENFVIGGASIYQQLMPFVQKMYLTHVNTVIEADVYFPAIDNSEWDIGCDAPLKDEKSGLDFRFCTYIRKLPIH